MAIKSVFVLTETCERESVLIGSYATKEEAFNEMKSCLLEHLKDAMNAEDGDEEFEEAREGIEDLKPNEYFETNDYAIYSDNAWSNVDDDNLSDWNIFEAKIPAENGDGA